MRQLLCIIRPLGWYCLAIDKLLSGTPAPGLQGSVESGWADTESTVDIRAWSKPPCFAWLIFTGLRIRETGSSERGTETDRKRDGEDGEWERQTNRGLETIIIMWNHILNAEMLSTIMVKCVKPQDWNCKSRNYLFSKFVMNGVLFFNGAFFFLKIISFSIQHFGWIGPE